MAIFEKEQQSSQDKSKENKPKEPPHRPQTPFEEKSEWTKNDLKKRIMAGSPYVPGTGGRFCYSRQERKEMIETAFPSKRFGSYISEDEAKKRLREMKIEENKAKTSDEKLKIKRARKYLTDQFGF